MDIHECSFCKNKMGVGTGKMVVNRNGSVLYFCSSKCQKNSIKLKRIPRRVSWIRKAK